MISAFNFIILDWSDTVLNWLIRLFIAAVCGFAIGFERKTRSKEAGIRTHTIVCFAAALMMIVSKYAFTDLFGAATDGSNVGAGTRGADSARIAAQVVSGIGFLGAGIIFYKRDLLRGLTTAAGIWATAGIGLAIGSGMIVVGVVASAVLIVLQVVLHSRLKVLHGRTQRNFLRITAVLENSETIDKINAVFGIKQMLKFKTYTVEKNEIRAEIEAITENEFSAKELYEFTNNYSFIRTVEKTDEL